MYYYNGIDFPLLLLSALCWIIMLFFLKKVAKIQKSINGNKTIYANLIKKYKEDNLISIVEIESIASTYTYPFLRFLHRAMFFNILLPVFFLVFIGSTLFSSKFYTQIWLLFFALFCIWEIFWLLYYNILKRKTNNLSSQKINEHMGFLNNPNVLKLATYYDSSILSLFIKITVTFSLISIFMNSAMLILTIVFIPANF